MKNQKIETPEGPVWKSRSVSTEGYVLTTDDEGNYCILVCKRGKGGSYPGLWNVPSGYLDYHETTEQCCIREIKEETGVDITMEDYSIRIHSIDSSPRVYNQNIAFKYIIHILGFPEDYNLSTAFSEEDEVEEVRWIYLEDYEQYVWAFHQKEVMDYLYKTYYR